MKVRICLCSMKKKEKENKAEASETQAQSHVILSVGEDVSTCNGSENTNEEGNGQACEEG